GRGDAIHLPATGFIRIRAGPTAERNRSDAVVVGDRRLDAEISKDGVDSCSADLRPGAADSGLAFDLEVVSVGGVVVPSHVEGDAWAGRHHQARGSDAVRLSSARFVRVG